MKIKVKKSDYLTVSKKEPWRHELPIRQNGFWRFLLSALSSNELKEVNFHPEGLSPEEFPPGPVLFLMNHSSFTDLMIVARLLKNRPYHIVCTNDGFIGKAGLMRRIGCIPTRKFIGDVTLVKDLKYCVDKLQSSVVMYPEASYSFDGTETPLPDSLGQFVRFLGVPVIMIRTKGAFLRDPLYNNLQKRNTSVSAALTLLCTKEEVKALPTEELQQRIEEAFHYDHFREQVENGVLITEPFRADGLHRVLYKCSSCETEGKMEGKGITLTCRSCGKIHTLKETGLLEATDGKTRFSYITDWYAWERVCVSNELEEGTYRADADVRILMLKDEASMYEVGEGHLTHTLSGFHLTGCDGQIEFTRSPVAAYSLYADYFWYELGDMVSIGTVDEQYYCFPKDPEALIVAKTRLAAEELYKKEKKKRRPAK